MDSVPNPTAEEVLGRDLGDLDDVEELAAAGWFASRTALFEEYVATYSWGCDGDVHPFARRLTPHVWKILRETCDVTARDTPAAQVLFVRVFREVYAGVVAGLKDFGLSSDLS